MGRLRGGSFMLGFGWGTVGGYHIFSIVFSFYAVGNCSFMAGA